MASRRGRPFDSVPDEAVISGRSRGLKSRVVVGVVGAVVLRGRNGSLIGSRGCVIACIIDCVMIASGASSCRRGWRGREEKAMSSVG